METALTFTLGILSGLFLIGMVYTFLGLLKMQKEHKKLLETINYLDGNIKSQEGRLNTYRENIHRDTSDMFSDIRREMDNRHEELSIVMGSNNSEAHRRMDEIHRYIDSRIDKTVDALCTRMDIKDELSKQKTKSKGISKEEMLNS